LSVTAIGLAMGGNVELGRRLAGIANALERASATVEEAAAALMQG
jgi:hypothetical protein